MTKDDITKEAIIAMITEQLENYELDVPETSILPYIEKHTKPLHDKIAALEKEVAELRSAKQVQPTDRVNVLADGLTSSRGFVLPKKSALKVKLGSGKGGAK
jgi:hypothetical protein